MKKTSIAVIAVLIISAGIFLYTKSYSQSQPRHYIVKLYGGNSVVAQWDAFDWGTVDGKTLVFTVGDRHNPTRVRIQGTYSVEEFN